MKISRRAITLGGLSTGLAAAGGVSMNLLVRAKSLSPADARQIAEDPSEASPSIIDGSWKIPPVVKVSL